MKSNIAQMEKHRALAVLRRMNSSLQSLKQKSRRDMKMKLLIIHKKLLMPKKKRMLAIPKIFLQTEIRSIQNLGSNFEISLVLMFDLMQLH